MTERKWTQAARYGVPIGEPTTIPLTVHGGKSHPLAILIARLAPLGVAVAENLSDLSEQDTATLIDITRDLNKLRRSVENLEEDAILAVRAAGASWAALANALDIDSRQTAKDRHNRIAAAHAQGLNVHGAAQEAERAEQAMTGGITTHFAADGSFTTRIGDAD